MSWFWGSSKKSNDESSSEGSYDDSSYETDSEAESLEEEEDLDEEEREEEDEGSNIEEDDDEELSFLNGKEQPQTEEAASIPAPETTDVKIGSNSSSEESTIEDVLGSVGSPKGGSMATTVSHDLTEEDKANETTPTFTNDQLDADNPPNHGKTSLNSEAPEHNPQDDEQNKEDTEDDADSQRVLGDCGFVALSNKNDNPQEDATDTRILRQTTSEEEEEDQELGELVLQGAIPGEVMGNRDRAPSGVTFDDDNTSHDDQATLESGDLTVELDSDHEEDEDSDDERDNDKPEETSLQDKQSLLVLAAEHDRVDILNNLLQECGDNNPELKKTLLQGGLPPLHVAVLCGSMNALNCLLRVGADPSFRPTLQNLPQEQSKAISNAYMMDGKSAWELVSLAKLAKAKQEGIQHAFCAEALRCIGSDEDDRLKQLLDAGITPELSVGDKTLKDWSVEMKAPLCQKLLGVVPKEDLPVSEAAVPGSSHDASGESKEVTKSTSAVLDRPKGEESISSLSNRLDELESLARALSSCLDNLGEETSVCTGLLLMGGGASALATHVRSLKTTKENMMDELDRLREAYENSQDELAYWVREMGAEGEAIAQSMTIVPPTRPRPELVSDDQDRTSQMLQAQIAASEVKVRKLRVSIGDLSEENTRNLAEVERRGLTGGIQLVRNLRDELREIDFEISQLKMEDATCHAKIHLIQTKLKQKKAEDGKQKKMEIPALTVATNEESTTVEKSVKPTESSSEPAPPPQDGIATPEEDDQRETPFETKKIENGISATPNDEILQNGTIKPEIESESDETHAAASSVTADSEQAIVDRPDATVPAAESRSIVVEEDTKPTAESAKIANGESTALVLRGEGPRGFLPMNIWQMILRIIGVRPEVATIRPAATQRNRNAQPAVIL